jgi:hypothetical protein
MRRDPKGGNRQRSDGRRALLLYFRLDVIKRLKIAALDEDRPAYKLAEEAVCEWLDRYRKIARGKRSDLQRPGKPPGPRR